MKKTRGEGEWEILYRALCAVCAKYGKEDPFGDGDYWIVDDCWGTAMQKICVFSPGFLTPGLAADISRCIRDTHLPEAEVVVALDIQDPDVDLAPMGILVNASGYEERWDLGEIRRQLGQDFFAGEA